MTYTCEDCGQKCNINLTSNGEWSLVWSDCHGADIVNARGEIVTYAEAVAAWEEEGAEAQGAL